MNFLFSCPVCDTPLEATPADAGQTTTCPICGQAFPIPVFDRRSGRIWFDPARTPQRPKESMAYLHAYASDGRMAPLVVRGKDGSVQICCARCKRMNPPQANWCIGCRMPFAVESGGRAGPAVGTGGAGGGAAWVLGVLGVVLGLASIPCFMAVAFAWLPGLLSSGAAFTMSVRAPLASATEAVARWGLLLCALDAMMHLSRHSG